VTNNELVPLSNNSQMDRDRIWLVLGSATLIAGIATAGSLWFSLGLVPCDLCWYQRILMYPLVMVMGVAAIEARPTVWRTSIPLSVLGGVIATYHTVLQARQPPAPSKDRVPLYNSSSCRKDDNSESLTSGIHAHYSRRSYLYNCICETNEDKTTQPMIKPNLQAQPSIRTRRIAFTDRSVTSIFK
jgi:hypothetical protein